MHRVKWMPQTNGVYTASNFNGVGLYTHSSGTLTRVAISTDDGNIWKTGGGSAFQSKAFSSTYAASAGLHYIGMIYSSSSQTTQPGILMTSASALGGNTIMSSFDFTNSNKSAASINTQTTITTPLSLNTTSNLNNRPMLYLY